MGRLAERSDHTARDGLVPGRPDPQLITVVPTPAQKRAHGKQITSSLLETMLQQRVEDELGHEVTPVEPGTPNPDRFPGEARALQDQRTSPIGPEPALMRFVEPDLGLGPITDAQLEAGQHLEGKRLACFHLEGVIVQFSLLFDRAVDDGREADFLSLGRSMVRRFDFILEFLIHQMEAQGVGEAVGTHETEVVKPGTGFGRRHHFEHGQELRFLPVLAQEFQRPPPVVFVLVLCLVLRDLAHGKDTGVNVVTLEPDGVSPLQAFPANLNLERRSDGTAQGMVRPQLRICGLGLVIGVNALKAPQGEAENRQSWKRFPFHWCETLMGEMF